MTNNQSDELLREVLGELGQLRQLLAERLPPPVKIGIAPAGPSGVRQAVVTGEGDQAAEAGKLIGPPPVTTKPPVKKAAQGRR